MNNKWVERQIGDDCFVGDGAHAKIPRQNAGIMYLTSKNFKSDGLDLTKIDYISEDFFKKYFKDNSKSSKKPTGEDVLFSIIGTIGEPYLVKEQDYFGISSSVAILRPNKSVLFPKYLYYWIKGHILQSALYGVKSGVAQGFVSLEMIKSLPLWYPILSTQRKIAAILSSYDNLIENNTLRIKILDEVAHSLYRDWFVKFKFPGHEKVRIVESELGMVPDGWKIVRVGEHFTTVLGGTPSTKRPEFWEGGSIPWINSGKVNELRIVEASELITPAGLKKSSTKMMPKRATVLAITGATLGQVSLLEIETCANQSVVGIWDEENIYSEYIYLTFCNIIEKVILSASGGAQQHINKEVVNGVQIFIPPIKIMKSFNDIIRPIFDSVVNLIWRNANLRGTRDLLLPKLISGELNVGNMDIVSTSGE